MMENAEDRRGALRFAIGLDLQFREIGDGPNPVQGGGKTVDISSDAILFTPDCDVNPGTRLEVSVAWPVRLDGRIALKFVARGVVMGYRKPNAVVAIQYYEFRTQRGGPEAAPVPANGTLS
ncbi:MAG TPA: hypothetical protein VLT57_08300 [Bryobacteraceae bacterium]|nr:hypothetical protein [Bryobacteraceae bacterium]